jgi:hypothetical protein
MLGAPLIRYEVVRVRQPSQKRLLASFGMVEALHVKSMGCGIFQYHLIE